MEQKSSIKTVPDKEESLLPMRQWTFFVYRGFTLIYNHLTIYSEYRLSVITININYCQKKFLKSLFLSVSLLTEENNGNMAI